MKRPLITLLFAVVSSLGLCSGARAAILGFETIESSITGSASTVDAGGLLDADDFSDDHPASNPALPLQGDADSFTPAGSSAVSSAFADGGFVFVDTEVFDSGESAEASALADFNARFTGTGGIVTLLVNVDHQADTFGTDAFTATELLLQVFGPGGTTLVDLALPLGASNVLQIFNPAFALGAGSVADLAVTLFAESASDAVFGEAFSATSVNFVLDAAPVAMVNETSTMALLLAAGSVLATRRRRTKP